jgi:hypothetical protein
LFCFVLEKHVSKLLLAFSSVSSANTGYVCHLPVCFVLDTLVGFIF